MIAVLRRPRLAVLILAAALAFIAAYGVRCGDTYYDSRTATSTTRAVYFVGDSITAGAGIDPTLVTRDSYPWRTAALLCGVGCTDVHVVAHSGQCLAYTACGYGPTLLQTIETEVLQATPTPTEVVILIGRNDLWHITDAQLEDAFFQLWLLVHSYGIPVRIGTILPSTTTYAAAPLTEPQRARINTWLRPFFGDQIIDYAAAVQDPNGYLPATYSNPGDGVHPNRFGGLVVADAAIAAGVGQ